MFFTRAVEKVDAQAGLLVVKILERRSALLGLDSPQKLDVVQVQATKEPTQHERIKEAIMRVANSAPPAQRAVIKMMDELGPDKVLEMLNASKGNGASGPSGQTH